MVRKTERVTEIFPDADQIEPELEGLTDREMAILAAGTLDITLAEMISRRLLNIPKECEDFLGLNGDGRAPAGSFGARIQLSLLLGLITEPKAAVLRALKELRNLFAHRVVMSFAHPDAQKALTRLHAAFKDMDGSLHNEERAAGGMYKRIKEDMKTDPKAAAWLVRQTYVYLAYNFHLWITEKHCTRIERLAEGIVFDKERYDREVKERRQARRKP